MRPSPFKRAVSGSSGLDQTPPDVQIVLVTQGGLELPLVESPGQVARLLEVVSEMAADTDRDRPLMSRLTSPIGDLAQFERIRCLTACGSSFDDAQVLTVTRHESSEICRETVQNFRTSPCHSHP